jgi:multicomponent Na+:H+ antiporter subunit F
VVLTIALLCLIIAILLTLYRLFAGPTWGDRITALDFLSTSIAVLMVVIALKSRQPSLLDAAILVSILGFLSTVALARYILGGRVMK